MVDDNKHKGFAPPIFQKLLRSNYFNTMSHILVLLDAGIAASLEFDHKTKQRDHKFDDIYYAQVFPLT